MEKMHVSVDLILSVSSCCRFQNLRLLDFRKIKRNERNEANEIFKTKAGKELLKEVSRKAKQSGGAVAEVADTTAKGELSEILLCWAIF